MSVGALDATCPRGSGTRGSFRAVGRGGCLKRRDCTTPVNSVRGWGRGLCVQQPAEKEVGSTAQLRGENSFRGKADFASQHDTNPSLEMHLSGAEKHRLFLKLNPQ